MSNRFVILGACMGVCACYVSLWVYNGNLWGILWINGGSLWTNMSMRVFMNAMGAYGCLRESVDNYKYVSVYECLSKFVRVYGCL